MNAQSEAELAAWLDTNALSLDTEAQLADELLPRLAASGVVEVGVATSDGGAGGDIVDALEAVAAVSERSLAAGFVLWGHRSYIEYLLHCPNTALREELLPELLAGRVAGATGLSNAMKFLYGLEELQVSARQRADGFILDGRLPWVTNLRPQSFHVAVAVAYEDRRGAFIASLRHDDPGHDRSADLDLMALRATNTAAVTISGVEITGARIIHPDANSWLPSVRPGFLGLQCGMSIGLARRALGEARGYLGPARGTLAEPVADLAEALVTQERRLREGLRSGCFEGKPAELFHIRIALAEIVAQALALELQATGGRAYLTTPGAGFARRWREAAFIPVITPSLVQLKTVLAAK
jgi:alkylation response protein AidB-like acyl-CoA dehydrogenase